MGGGDAAPESPAAPSPLLWPASPWLIFTSSVEPPSMVGASPHAMETTTSPDPKMKTQRT